MHCSIGWLGKPRVVHIVVADGVLVLHLGSHVFQLAGVCQAQLLFVTYDGDWVVLSLSTLIACSEVYIDLVDDLARSSCPSARGLLEFLETLVEAADALETGLFPSATQDTVGCVADGLAL